MSEEGEYRAYLVGPDGHFYWLACPLLLRTQGFPSRWSTRRRFDPSSSPSATHIRRPDFSIDGWAENPQ
jgi:hypothetical protein